MAAPKKEKEPIKGCQIVCPPDRHIPVEFPEIYSLVRTDMSVSERIRFEQIAQLVESLYAQEFMILKRNLKHNFLRFSMGAKDQPLISLVGGGLPTVAELDAAEVKLVADWLQLMAAGRFHVLTRAEWDLAKADSFMFSLPVEVNWQYYDDKMLRTFWASNPERRALRERLPDMADRVLVFHRGVSVAQASGLYTSEKVDMLVDYLVAQPLGKLWNRIRGRKPAPSPPPPARLNLTGGNTHSARKVVERRTLRLLMPNAWEVIKNFPKKLDLQEPAFKEVVVLYRAAAVAASQSRGGGGGNGLLGGSASGGGSGGSGGPRVPALQRSLEQRQREILAGRNIHIKCFHDIPMADMEVIFADKKVYLKTLTVLQIIIVVVGALFAAFTVIIKAGRVDLSLLYTAVSLVFARCTQVYTSAQAERSKAIQDMVNILYDKTSDSQEGVVCMLLEDMADQQLKEAVLTYGLLYNREAEMTQAMIDLDCERFLRKNFDLAIDFAVEDALPRLEHWGLVRRVQHKGASTAKYEAVHPETASMRLQEHWHRAFRALSDPPVTATYPLTNLLSGEDRAPALNADTLFQPSPHSSSSPAWQQEGQLDSGGGGAGAAAAGTAGSPLQQQQQAHQQAPAAGSLGGLGGGGAGGGGLSGGMPRSPGSPAPAGSSSSSPGKPSAASGGSRTGGLLSALSPRGRKKST